MKRKLVLIAAFVLGLGVTSWMANADAKQQGNKNTARGQKLFMQYCASCHGADGKGNGPAASSLKSFLPDLTKIPKVNGKFPGLQVLNAISGEKNIPAHGSKEMPVWGQVLRERKGETNAKLDIYALQEYVESIQQK